MQEHVSVILLSGGQGRRFGNRDKGLLTWRGKPLVEHVIQRLLPQCDQLLISCHRNVEYYQSLRFDAFVDETTGFQGPLAGIQSTFLKVRHPWCLLCPNDMPLIPSDLVARLLEPMLKYHWQLAYPVCNDRPHYLPALLRADILDTSINCLHNGTRSLHRWYQQFTAGTVDFSSQSDAFANINTPEALAALDQRHKAE